MRPAPLAALTAALLLAASAAHAAASPDGRMSWDGGDSVTLDRPQGFAGGGTRVPLPRLPKGARRRVVFPRRGDVFGVLDEDASAVGLHLGAPRASEAAFAVVSGALLRLVDRRGRVLWTKRLPDTYSVGPEGGFPPLEVAADGTAAVLLQDSDPYTKERPLILVIDPRGRELIRLDYASWSRVDELRLSDDGRWLAVRGIGRIPAADAWGAALGSYGLADGSRNVVATREAAGLLSLRAVDRAGTACCLQEGRSLFAVAHDGSRTALSGAEAARRFGPSP